MDSLMEALMVEVQTYIKPGSHLICDACVLLLWQYRQNAIQRSHCLSKMKLDVVIDHAFSL